ncbi:hypothetical protein [Micromonospora andamanensis]|uniref:hypothetical protein n=1 Tax=Micromonospora andamanensis TaxID=1287068 RepID=UPI00194DC359|nr:hypothetical protein [Micromonospora andamanensis]
MTTAIVEAAGTFTQATKTPFAMWLDALRSGDYRQGTGLLRCKDQFCCLGVSCDIAVEQGVIPEPERDGNTYFYGDGSEECFLPPEVFAWLGLDTSDPLVGADGARQFVTHLNDAAGLTFPEIADLLEATFPHLMTATPAVTPTPTV